MAAEGEEVVLDADAIDAKHRHPDRREHLFHRRAGRDEAGAQLERGEIGLGKARAVDLAVRSARQRIERNERRRHHVVRQRLSDKATKLVYRGDGRRRIRGDNVCDEPTIAGRDFARRYRRLANRRMRANGCFDFLDLDAEAADLHLIVGAAQELDDAIGEQARTVAGAIQPPRGRIR